MKTVKAALGGLVSFIAGLHFMIKILFVAMTLEYVTFLVAKMVAGNGRRVDFAILRKLVIICLVASAEMVTSLAHIKALTPWGDEWGFGALMAGYYAVSESFSIIGNLTAIGIPVPKAVVSTLERLREYDKG